MPLSITKSTDETLYVEMPHFDLKDQLHQDSLEAQGLKSGFRFAYKFITDYTPENSGIHFTTADGTRVWRLGIHSANAYSINLLFSKYELPKGASLFLYNANQTQVIGSFNYLNNSEKKLLPVRPIDGDRVIIEYQEPKDVAFHGVLQVGEVNHGYRDLRAYKEPQPSWNSFKCMNPLSFYQKQTTQYDNIARSVVLMIIDGGVLCTGSLINNTANDKRPYILTASHCLNDSFDVENPDYESVAGSIVFFFNYETPTTSTDFLGTEEMSMYQDPEQREKEIKNISAVFSKLADEILPQLRRSRLTANVEIIGKSDEEISKLAKEDPSKLSVEESLYAATLTNDNAEKTAIYNKATELYPNDYRTWNNAGMMAFRNGDLSKAEEFFNKANSIQNNPEANMNLGLIALTKGDQAKAQQLFGSASGVNELSEALGVLYLEQGEYEKAANSFGSVKTNNAALAQILTKDYSKAAQTLNAVANPSAITSYLKAIVAARTNDASGVISNLKSAISADKSLAKEALNDLEFAKYATNSDFTSLVK